VSFLHPALFAAGAAAVAIPIIIHLLMRRRRKPIEWAAMRFLLEAYRKHKRRLRLEQLLLLATRCLIIALLGAALARPFFGDSDALARGPETVYLIIDNSLTASAKTDGEQALERHKRLAASIVGTLDAARGDRVGLITLGGPAEPVVIPPSSELSGVAQTIRSLETVDSAADVAGAIAAIRDDLDARNESDQRAKVRIVVLSDFLEGSADLTRAIDSIDDAGAHIDLFASRPSSGAVDNIAVVAVEPLRPVVVTGRSLPGPDGDSISGSTQVRVVVRRSGPGVSDADATKIRLGFERSGGADPLGQYVVRWAPGQTEATASLTADLRNIDRTSGRGVLIAQIDGDAIAADNTRRTEIALRETLRVAIVAPSRFGARPSIERFDNGDWVRLALHPLGDRRTSLAYTADVELIDVSPDSVDAPHLAGVDAVFVASPHLIDRAAWKRLRALADRGGLVAVVPPAGEQAHLWADAMIDEFSLAWTVEPETQPLDEPVSLALGAGGNDDLDLLSMLAAELEELIEPVSVERILAFGPTNGNELLRAGDTPFLLAARPGESERGLVVVFAAAFDLGWTDLPAKPLMVPLMQEIIRQGVGRARGSWSSVAGASPATPEQAALLTPLTNDGGTDLRVQSGGTTEPIRLSGAWRAVDERGATRGIVVVNADNAASATDIQPESDVADWLSVIGGRAPTWLDAQTPEHGLISADAGLSDADSSLSLILLLFAAALALFEVALARFASHAHATGPVTEAAA